MAQFTTLTSRFVVIPACDIDTDQIIPARFLKATDKNGMGDNLFADWRYHADGSPKAIEIDQAQRLAYNTPSPNVVIMIQNRYGKEAIDQKAVEQFISSVVDAVRDGAGDGHLNVRDPRIRESIIRYFDAYKPK